MRLYAIFSLFNMAIFPADEEDGDDVDYQQQQSEPRKNGLKYHRI